MLYGYDGLKMNKKCQEKFIEERYGKRYNVFGVAGPSWKDIAMSMAGSETLV